MAAPAVASTTVCSQQGRFVRSQISQQRGAVPLLLRQARFTQRAAQRQNATCYRADGYGCGPRGQNFRRGASGPFVQWNVTPEMANAAAKSFADFMREFQAGPNPWGNPTGQRRPEGQQQNPWREAMNAATLPLDVEEQSTSYVVSADVPGLQKADLKIQISQKERTLTISGERQRPVRAEPVEGEAPQYRVRHERRFGKFSRSLPLPEDADLAAVTARVDKGVLMVTVQKVPQEEKPSDVHDVDIQ